MSSNDSYVFVVFPAFTSVRRLLTLLAFSYALLLAVPGQLFAVTGGSPAELGSADWMVGLADYNAEIPTDASCLASGGSELFCRQYCGGVLISPNWVLTAGHCVDNRLADVGDLRLLIGGENLNVAAPALMTASAKYVHPGHFTNDAVFNDDLALLRLSSPASNTPASLTRGGDFTALQSAADSLNDEVQVFGYGRLASNGIFSPVLQQVAIDLNTDNFCESAYNFDLFVNYFPALMLCASEPQASEIEANDAGGQDPADPDGEDACTLDSGSPLFDARQDMQRVIGVVSFGDRSNCGDPAKPSVYTQLDAYLSWIEDTASTAGQPVGDLALDWAVSSSNPVNVAVPVTVNLRNRSQSTSFTSSSFTITSDAAATLSVNNAGLLSCAVVSGGFQCSYAPTLLPNATLTATFTLTPAVATETVAELRVERGAQSVDDYRVDNDSLAEQVVFSSTSPNLLVENLGFIARGSDTTDGQATLFLRAENRSASVAANSVLLTLAYDPLQDYVFTGAVGATCAQTDAIRCDLGTLGVSTSLDVEIMLTSQEQVGANIDVALTAANGDFPTLDLNGASDNSFSALLQFILPPEPAAPASGSKGSGGVSAWWWLTLLLLRRR